jgi:hypothetical protein
MKRLMYQQRIIAVDALTVANKLQVTAICEKCLAAPSLIYYVARLDKWVCQECLKSYYRFDKDIHYTTFENATFELMKKKLDARTCNECKYYREDLEIGSIGYCEIKELYKNGQLKNAVALPTDEACIQFKAYNLKHTI